MQVLDVQRVAHNPARNVTAIVVYMLCWSHYM